MAKPKFDYDGEDFYKEIYALAMQGLNDGEIAYSLEDNFGVGLTPSTFAAMKGGNYKPWSKEENKRRGERITYELAHGRSRINGIVRGRYLKTALGGIKVKGKSIRRKHMVVDGQQTEDMVVEIVENEQETPPNVQALANWLYHHDPQFRKIQKGIDESEDNGIPFDPKNGIAIQAWIRKEIEVKKEVKGKKK